MNSPIPKSAPPVSDATLREEHAFAVNVSPTATSPEQKTIVDLTDSAELRRQAAFAHFNPNPVLELSVEGTINYCNAATGAMVQRLNLHHAWQMLPLQTAAIVRGCLATGQPCLRLETEIHGRTLSWSFFPVPQANVAHCYAGDVTERKQAEAEVRRNAELLRRILLSSRDCIKTLDIDGRLLTMNEGGRCLMEIDDVAPLLNRPWTDFWRGPDLELAVAALTTVRADGVGQFIGHCPTAKGSPKWWDVVLTPILDSAGQVECFLVVSRDITERRELEEQLRQSQKMEAIGQLSGGVAHDFNNLLTVIKGHIGLLRLKDQVSPEIAESIQQIDGAADRAANLTRQLLTFSRQEVIHPVNLNLNGLVFTLAKMLRRLVSENIEIKVECAPLPLPIHADTSMVEQVLLNLVVNARDAMPTGGTLLVVTTAIDLDESAASLLPHARPGAFVCLTVSDTGTGIAPETMPRIFEPFFTTKEIGKGTGLGLATVYGVMQQHNGWVNVESVEGRGTTFRAYFPRLNTTPEEVVAMQSAGIHGGHETVLFVEDEETVRTVGVVALSGLGYRVLPAKNGVEALQLWQIHRHEIDLLITDLVMPGGINGRQLAERLVAGNPRLPVIYISGYSHDVAGNDFPLQDGHNYLAKPFDVAKLARITRANL